MAGQEYEPWSFQSQSTTLNLTAWWVFHQTSPHHQALLLSSLQGQCPVLKASSINPRDNGKLNITHEIALASKASNPSF